MASATIFLASRSAFRFADLADLADPVGGVGLRLLLQATNELGLGVLRRHAGHLLEAAALLGDQLLELLLAVGDGLLAAAEVARAAPELLVALLEQLELAVERRLALLDPALVALDLLAALVPLLFATPRGGGSLLLAGDDGGLAEGLRFAAGFLEDAARVSSAVELAAICALRSARRPVERPKMKKAAAATMDVPSAARSAVVGIRF